MQNRIPPYWVFSEIMDLRSALHSLLSPSLSLCMWDWSQPELVPWSCLIYSYLIQTELSKTPYVTFKAHLVNFIQFMFFACIHFTYRNKQRRAEISVLCVAWFWWNLVWRSSCVSCFLSKLEKLLSNLISHTTMSMTLRRTNTKNRKITPTTLLSAL